MGLVHFSLIGVWRRDDLLIPGGTALYSMLRLESIC